MKQKDAQEILNEGEPDHKLQYVCACCDTDYTDEGICCEQFRIMYHNSNMNTPHDEWVLAGLVMREYELNTELRKVQDAMGSLGSGSRY